MAAVWSCAVCGEDTLRTHAQAAACEESHKPWTFPNLTYRSTTVTTTVVDGVEVEETSGVEIGDGGVEIVKEASSGGGETGSDSLSGKGEKGVSRVREMLNDAKCKTVSNVTCTVKHN